VTHLERVATPEARYHVVGTIEDCPPGHARHTMAKRFH